MLKENLKVFIEDEETQAANVETPETQPTSPVESVDQTKAFAARLKEEKSKAKLEAREEIAKEFGYNSWDEYSNAQTTNKLLDKGLDPESVLPVIKEIIKGDPDYQKAMEYKAREEALEKEMFATNSLKALNEKFGTSYKNISELDEETIKMWNEGATLEKAYAANNWEKIRDNAIKSSVETGKSHLTTVTGGNSQSTEKVLTDEQLRAFQQIGGFTKEQVMEYYKKHQN